MSDVLTHAHIALPMDQIADYCRRWKITELSLFGSVLTDRFRPDSDVDVLVTFEPHSGWTILDFVRAERELSAIVGRQVDLINRRAIENSGNRFLIRSILQSAYTIYAAQSCASTRHTRSNPTDY